MMTAHSPERSLQNSDDLLDATKAEYNYTVPFTKKCDISFIRRQVQTVTILQV
jgi:hypothetical protein